MALPRTCLGASGVSASRLAASPEAQHRPKSWTQSDRDEQRHLSYSDQSLWDKKIIRLCKRRYRYVIVLPLWRDVGDRRGMPSALAM